jgi:peptidoglycan-associated lipoprotein
MMKLASRIVLVCLLFATAAWAQQVQVSADYLYLGSNRAPGATDWFAADGGRADVSVGDWRHLSFVGEFAGAHTSNLTSSGTGQTLFTALAGPRRSIILGRGERRKISAFAQALLGDVHASDGLFPSGPKIESSADSFALSTGGGLEAGLNHGISLRLIQADYLYTHLPNHYDSYESSFRIGAGVAFRLR